MKRTFLLILLAFPLLADTKWNSWNEVFESGWTPPKKYYVAGYSEFTPAYHQGVMPYELNELWATPIEDHKKSLTYSEIYNAADPEKYFISYLEEHRWLRPDLKFLATHLLPNVSQLAAGHLPGGPTLKSIPQFVAKGNPFIKNLPKLENQTIVSFIPFQMSRFHQDLGRSHPWAIYGGADSDWEFIFWSSVGATDGNAFFCNLLAGAFEKKLDADCDLSKQKIKFWAAKKDLVPGKLKNHYVDNVNDVSKLDYLVTFQPYDKWSPQLQKAFEKREIDILPHPATLVFYKAPLFQNMKFDDKEKDIPAVREILQIPLSIELSAYSNALSLRNYYGLRALDVVRKGHRFARTKDQRREEPSSIQGKRIVAVDAKDESETPYNLIFRAIPTLMGLYGKPIARNIRAWAYDEQYEKSTFVMDGTRSDLARIDQAKAWIDKNAKDNIVHYQNFYPPMEVNGWDVYWFRPFVAWMKPNKAININFDLNGVVNFRKGKKDLWLPMAIAPEDGDKTLLEIIDGKDAPDNTVTNIKKIEDFYNRLGKQKLTVDAAEALTNPGKLSEKAKKLITKFVDEKRTEPLKRTYTFEKSRTSEYETEYWQNIVNLSEGIFNAKLKPVRNTNNADCAGTDKNKKKSHLCEEELRLYRVGDYLQQYYKDQGLSSHFHNFTWKTEFHIDWWYGKKDTQRNIVTVIPASNGNPNNEVVIIGDHYDTAYQHDIFEEGKNKRTGEVDEKLIGHRLASKGADDNYSATSTTMLAAKLLKGLPTKRDIWIVNITGEEFPADGLGIRALVNDLIVGNQIIKGKPNPKVVGLYVMDMIAHHRGRDPKVAEKRAIFQISPGSGAQAGRLAMTAHHVTQTYNHLIKAEKWDEEFNRKKVFERFVPPKKSKPENWKVPTLGLFLPLVGEIRPGYHHHSSFYQTDPIVAALEGIASVLFMENYDVDREGYHSTEDDIENIDLDYGRGVSAIAIETIAQIACQ